MLHPKGDKRSYSEFFFFEFHMSGDITFRVWHMKNVRNYLFRARIYRLTLNLRILWSIFARFDSFWSIWLSCDKWKKLFKFFLSSFSYYLSNGACLNCQKFLVLGNNLPSNFESKNFESIFVFLSKILYLETLDVSYTLLKFEHNKSIKEKKNFVWIHVWTSALL